MDFDFSFVMVIPSLDPGGWVGSRWSLLGRADADPRYLSGGNHSHGIVPICLSNSV